MTPPLLGRSYPAAKQAIASIRHDVAAVAAFLGADGEAVENVRLAVSEAATHVVQQAYAHTSGRIEISVQQLEDTLAVTVGDDGNRRMLPHNRPGFQLGFVVMRECTESLTVERSPNGGIEIRMRFALTPEARAGVRDEGASESGPSAYQEAIG